MPLLRSEAPRPGSQTKPTVTGPQTPLSRPDVSTAAVSIAAASRMPSLSRSRWRPPRTTAPASEQAYTKSRRP
eukprot:2854072-Prymnesium_polylepis.1